MHLREPDGLSHTEIELIEKQSLRVLFQATVDFGFESFEIFRNSTDNVTEVGEDTTRELLERMAGYHVQPAQRLYGNVDYRKARYVILPEYLVRQALFIDSKSEKSSKTATMQMSQLSMRVRQRRAGQLTDVAGKLPSICQYGQLRFLTTTLLTHYEYSQDKHGRRTLICVRLAAVPNGELQATYNPSEKDSIWLAGRNAYTRGEDFRVRLSFKELATKAPWRVQSVSFDEARHTIAANWSG